MSLYYGCVYFGESRRKFAVSTALFVTDCVGRDVFYHCFRWLELRAVTVFFVLVHRCTFWVQAVRFNSCGMGTRNSRVNSPRARTLVDKKVWAGQEYFTAMHLYKT